MGNIIILDENTANRIAAGEVIEKPASVIKELVENSLDAGASIINIEIKNGGISFIKVMDNGCGMDEDDVEIAFERHATSKIRNADDLASISSMGFRGEALASIAAVSSVQLVTRIKAKNHGTMINIKGGSLSDIKPTGCPIGTTITIRDLFFNTPARFKFLKKDTTEAGYVSDIISRIALGNPQVSFKLTSNGSIILHTPGNNDQLSSIFNVYGKETAKEVYQINYQDNMVRISGYIGKPEIARSNRNQQSIFINRRYVKNKVIASAVDEAYNTFLMKNKYAFFIINVDLNPELIDINVHPSKTEVKLSNGQDIFRSVYNAVSNALMAQSEVRTVRTASSASNIFRIQENKGEKVEYTQEKINFKDSLNFMEQSVIKETGICYKNTGTEIKPAIEKESEAGLSNLLIDSRLIGQAFSTYILLQQEDELILVDQHAAHERIMYEELKKRYESNTPMSQILLSPIVIELTHIEIEFLENETGLFEKMGFSYDVFGSNSIILRSVPFNGQGENAREIFLNVLDYVMNDVNSNRSINIDEALYTIACKSAVKANRKLDELEIKVLLERLSEMKNPYTCPHGRPSVIKLKKYDLEKMFKRIV